jgi:transcriptional regulator with XRE-family HTH domain
MRKFSDAAAVIRTVREDAGWSQAGLAEELGFSRDYMIDLESGRPNTFIGRLLRVFHTLGITVTLTYADRQKVTNEPS